MTDPSFVDASPSERQVTLSAQDRGYIYAVARRIVGSAEDADDVTQDVMLLAFRHRDAFRGEARYRTWLHRIAYTAALGYVRRRRRSREVLAATEAQIAARVCADTDSPEVAIAGAQARRLIHEAIARLEPKYRDVVLCRAIASDADTASRLGISVANVKIRAHRARKQLRPVLAPLR